MAKWEKKLDQILKDEKEKHKAVYELRQQLHKTLHGFTPVDKNIMLNEVNKICDSIQLIGSEITSVEIQPRYKRSEEKDSNQIITINVAGDFSGYIQIETGGGWQRTDDGERLDIFYVYESDCKVFSDKENKIREYYKHFRKRTVEDLIDLVLDKDLYIEYDDCYKNYTLWHKKPSEYGDSVTGSLKLYDEIRDYKRYKGFFDSINQIIKTDNIEEFAEEKLNASYESTIYKWTEYKL